MTIKDLTMNEWRDSPECFAVGRLPAHAVTVPFDNVKKSLYSRVFESSYCMSLNGIWKFRHACRLSDMPEDFWKPEFDLAEFEEIEVPLSWQMAGFGRKQYTNIAYPWELEDAVMPPYAPTVYNEVGSYVRTFDLPENFAGRRTILSLQGVESAYYLWINGVLVGYTEDTYTPSEFDITEYVTEKNNRIALRVFQWCTGSWLEDQDMWRLAGIFRDVYLYSVPQRYILDYAVDYDLDDAYRDADLAIRLRLLGEGKASKARARLFSPGGHLAAEKTAAISGDQVSVPFGRIDNPHKWSAEEPNCYWLSLSLLDDQEKETEIIGGRLGFRKLEIRDGVFYINGKRFVIKGLCKHEIDWKRGRAVTYEQLVKDARELKRANVNSIRTSHYPYQTEWYDLCDEYGLYVADEVNLESHGSWFSGQKEIGYTVPGNDPRWTELLLDRCNSMFHRDRNHPCVILWSLGNESFGGENLAAMASYFRGNDPTRFTFYESTFHCREYDSVSDIENQMYMRVNELDDYAKSNQKKPFITCEYEVCMGNSYGNLFKYIDLFDREKSIQGGYSWSWRDSGIYNETDDGRSVFAYGGDFGERLHDGAFCCNGILLPDGSPTPKLAVIKHAYRNFNVRLIDAYSGRIEVYSKNLFMDLADYDLHWTVLRNGAVAASGITRHECAPENKARFSLWGPGSVDYNDGGEYFLNVSVRRRKAELWCEAGFEDSLHQMPLSMYRPAIVSVPRADLSVRQTYGAVFTEGGDFRYVFSRRTGALMSASFKGKEFLAEPARPNFWRAMTDADIGNGAHVRCAMWRLAGQSLKLAAFNCGQEPGRFAAEAVYQLPVRPISSRNPEYRIGAYKDPVALPAPLAIVALRYSIQPSGMLGIEMELNTDRSLPEIPEIGYMLRLDKSFEDMEWYGNGPGDSYWDRPDGNTVGVYRDKAPNRFVRYVHSQECGNITGVRWLNLSAGGRILSVRAGNLPLEICALPYSPLQMEAASHPHLLADSNGTYLRICLHQMGLGGDDVWGGIAHEEFILRSGKPYRFNFFLSFR